MGQSHEKRVESHSLISVKRQNKRRRVKYILIGDCEYYILCFVFSVCGWGVFCFCFVIYLFIFVVVILVFFKIHIKIGSYIFLIKKHALSVIWKIKELVSFNENSNTPPPRINITLWNMTQFACWSFMARVCRQSFQKCVADLILLRKT